MASIALLNDDRKVLASVSAALKADGFKVDAYRDAQSALDAFDEQMPDLAVLNLKTSSRDGIELLRKLRRRSPLPIVMLSSKGDEIDEILALRMGADAFLRQPFSRPVVLERIRALLRRQTANPLKPEACDLPPAASPMVRGHLVVDPLRHGAEWKGNYITLTIGELRVLQALARQPGSVMTRDQLLEAVRSDENYPSDNTIYGHIKRIRQKMRAVDSGFSKIDTVYGVGYRYRPD